MTEEVDSCLELRCSADHFIPGVPASRVVPYKIAATTKLSAISSALCASLNIDHNIVQLAKRSLLSPLLHLKFCWCCQETDIILFGKNFTVAMKQEGLSR